jgi:hypothetical protein
MMVCRCRSLLSLLLALVMLSSRTHNFARSHFAGL